MIGSDVIRGYTDTMILFLLLDKPSYGYEISKQIQILSEDNYTMKETTLYSAFSRLEKKELIRSYSSSETFGKPRTYYTITPLGKTIYDEKIEEWSATKELIDQFIGHHD